MRSPARAKRPRPIGFSHIFDLDQSEGRVLTYLIRRIFSQPSEAQGLVALHEWVTPNWSRDRKANNRPAIMSCSQSYFS